MKRSFTSSSKTVAAIVALLAATELLLRVTVVADVLPIPTHLREPGAVVRLQALERVRREMGHVDVLFVSPTEHNMHVDPSVILINELDPEYILPQHRDTYRVTPENRYWTSGYPHEVKTRLSKPLRERFHILKQGEKPPVKPGRGDGEARKTPE
jgi:hypothetical protein